MKKITTAFLSLIFLFQISTNAQVVKNTSYTTTTGEKVLRLEMVIPADLTTTWQWFATDTKLQKWIAPLAHIELRTGGYIITNYDTNKTLSDSSSIKLPIINFLEKEMLTLKVQLNEHFLESVRAEDENLQEIIQFKKIDATHTKIISSMVGFGQSVAWDKTYIYFEKGNEWTFKQLLNNF